MQPAADRSSCGAELSAAERVAKARGDKVWENYSAEEEAAALAAAELIALEDKAPVPDKEKQVVELTLTEIVDGATFYAHVAGDAANVNALQQQVAAVCKKSATINSFEPKIGQFCCALFDVDGEWYRGKVTARTGAEYTVFFLDYGNTTVVGKKGLLPLDPTLDPKAGQYSPQALECKLAHCLAGPATDGGDGEAAAYALNDSAWDRVVVARVEDRSIDGALHVTLFENIRDPATNINEQMIAGGLLRVSKGNDKRALPLLKALRDKEDEARKNRRGMWRYGDVDDDDAMEFGMTRQKMEAAKATAAAAGGKAPNAWGKK